MYVRVEGSIGIGALFTPCTYPDIWDKVSGPNLVAYVNWTPIFDWWVIRCRCKGGHHKDMLKRDWTMCLKFV